MDWNKEIIKGPLPPWAIVICAILSGIFFCWLVDNTGTPIHGFPHLAMCFSLGVTCYLYLWFLARLAKNPTPWLRKNIRLLATIGGLINAALILWSMLSK